MENSNLLKLIEMHYDNDVFPDDIIPLLPAHYTLPEALFEALEETGVYPSFANEYGEPGYFLTAHANSILLSNWNEVSRAVQEVLEVLGFELEWEDEWLVCDQGKAWRTVPDCYHWQPSIVIEDHGGILTRDSPAWEWVEAYAVDDPGQPARAMPSFIDLQEEDFFLHNTDAPYETGWHYGQTDSPDAVLAEIFNEYDNAEVVFQVHEASQFYTRWDAWVRLDEELLAAIHEGPEFLTYQEVHERCLNPSRNLPWRWDGVCYVKSGYLKESNEFAEFSYNPSVGP